MSHQTQLHSQQGPAPSEVVQWSPKHDVTKSLSNQLETHVGLSNPKIVDWGQNAATRQAQPREQRHLGPRLPTWKEIRDVHKLTAITISAKADATKPDEAPFRQRAPQPCLCFQHRQNAGNPEEILLEWRI